MTCNGGKLGLNGVNSYCKQIFPSSAFYCPVMSGFIAFPGKILLEDPSWEGGLLLQTWGDQSSITGI